MKIASIDDVSSGFRILQTTKKSQTAVMVLAPGETSSDEMNVHENSDQILLVTEGEVVAEIGKEKQTMSKGDVCLIPAGTPHRFANKSAAPVVTFNVYAPPEYPG